MAKKPNIYHKRSSVVTNGIPKLPSPDQIEVGEIAINFASGYETISILNSESGVASFSCDDTIKKYISGSTSGLSSEVAENYVLKTTFNDHKNDTTTVAHLPAVTQSNNGNVMKVLNGEWQLVPSVSAVGQTAIENGNTSFIAITPNSETVGGATVVTLNPTLKVQGVSGSTQNSDGLATAYDVKTFVENNLTTIKTWSLSDIE